MWIEPEESTRCGGITFGEYDVEGQCYLRRCDELSELSAAAAWRAARFCMTSRLTCGSASQRSVSSSAANVNHEFRKVSGTGDVSCLPTSSRRGQVAHIMPAYVELRQTCNHRETADTSVSVGA